MDGFYRSKILKRLADNHICDENHCYVWTKNISNGYGTTHIFGKIYQVHTLSILFFKDFELDTKIRVKHKCKNKACFNPDHLEYKLIG